MRKNKKLSGSNDSISTGTALKSRKPELPKAFRLFFHSGLINQQAEKPVDFVLACKVADTSSENSRER
ncbi:hypothetical protein DEA98_03980 [Brucella pseudogrignonensis]|nr:hypothetical protein [Brucella pseudogrignonensis]